MLKNSGEMNETVVVGVERTPEFEMRTYLDNLHIAAMPSITQNGLYFWRNVGDIRLFRQRMLCENIMGRNARPNTKPRVPIVVRS